LLPDDRSQTRALNPGAIPSAEVDLTGLLALKSSLCADEECLPSWTAGPGVDPCSSFDGVYCGPYGAHVRVLEVQVQLNSSLLSFNDSALVLGDQLLMLPTLRQLVVLCVGKLISINVLIRNGFWGYHHIVQL
jgi:hypothetical protein